MQTIEEMRNSMLKAGVYTKVDIDKICELKRHIKMNVRK